MWGQERHGMISVPRFTYTFTVNNTAGTVIIDRLHRIVTGTIEPRDGVTVGTEFPLAEALVVVRQLMTCFHGLYQNQLRNYVYYSKKTRKEDPH